MARTTKTAAAKPAASTTDSQPPARKVEGNPDALAAAQSALETQAEQDRADAAGETDTIDVALVKVKITRDNTSTTIEVPEFELPIYELIHGEENVQEVSETSAKIAGYDPISLYDTLMRKFGKNGEEAVRQVYGSPEALAEELGVKITRSEVDEDGNKVRKRRNKSGEQALAIDFATDEPAALNANGNAYRIIRQRGKTSSKR